MIGTKPDLFVHLSLKGPNSKHKKKAVKIGRGKEMISRGLEGNLRIGLTISKEGISNNGQQDA